MRRWVVVIRQTFLCALVLASVVGWGVVASAPRASAAPVRQDNPWWRDTANWLVDSCSDAPVALLLSAAGTVTASGNITGGGLGLGREVSVGGAVPTSVSNPYPVGTPLWRQTELSKLQLKGALERAGLPVSGPTAAGKPAGLVTVATRGSVAGNAVAVAESATGNAVSTSVTSTGVKFSGATVAAVAATFAGSFCGTMNVLNFVSDKFEPDPAQGSLISSGLLDCAAAGGPAWSHSSAFRCVTFQTTMTFTQAFLRDQNAFTTGLARNWMTGETTNVDKLGGSATLGVIACPVWDQVRCGLIPVRMSTSNSGSDWSGEKIATYNGTSCCGQPREEGFVDGRQLWGERSRVKSTFTCRDPHTLTNTSVTKYSPWWYAIEEGLPADDLDMDGCAVGLAPVAVEVFEQVEKLGHHSQSGSDRRYPVRTFAEARVLHWAAPSDVVGNAAALQCLAVGASACAVHDPNAATEDPARTVYIGGPGGVPRTAEAAAPTIKTTLGDFVAAEPSFDVEDLDTDPEFEPPLDGGGGEDGCSTPQCIQPVPAGDSGDNCWANGWSWNPISWVYIPVKCALLWAFDPGDGFQEFKDHADEEMGDWIDLIGGLDDFLVPDETAGVCVTVEVDICTHSIMEIEFGTAVTMLFTTVWTLAAAWETLGFFVRMTDAT